MKLWCVGRDYLPFLTVKDVPSTGRVHRLPSATIGWFHHLLSDLEHQIFCQLDWHPEIVDIRVQFPIALEDSRALAERLGIAHPSFAGIDQVVTTDFIVGMNRVGRICRKAISARYAEVENGFQYLPLVSVEFTNQKIGVRYKLL